MPVRSRMWTSSLSGANTGPDAVATTLWELYTEAVVPKTGPCTHQHPLY